MSRENGSSSPAGWYVIAGEGDVVLRVRPGMKLGDDPCGKLCIAPAVAQVELGISDDGGLMLLACGEHELELASGSRIRRLDVSRLSRVQVSLVASRLSIDTDFAGAFHADDVQVRTVRTGVSPDDLIVLPEPPALAPDPAASAPGQASARRRAWEWPTAIVLGAVIVLAGLYFALPTAVDVPPSAGAQAATEPAQSAPATATDPVAIEPAPREPAVAEALASIAALLEAEQPSPASLELAQQSLKALSAAYPEDPQVQRVLERLTERRGREARPGDEHDAPRVASPAEPVAAPTSLAQSAPRLEPPSAPSVAPIPLPSARHRVVPDRAPGGASRSTPPASPSTARAAPASSSSRGVDWERLGEGVQAIAAARTIRSDLDAAEDALERGLLVQPPEQSAFTLYSRVLASDPESVDARRGLDSVRERLLSRVREQLAAEDVDAATTSLEDAARAGADPAAMHDLRSEVTYQRRLLDARAGRFPDLYPITALTAIRQEAPSFPPYSATGIERSVEMEFTVNETGEVHDVKVLGDPPRRFARAASQAVRRWQFEPVLEHNRPVPVRTAVRITFRNK